MGFPMFSVCRSEHTEQMKVKEECKVYTDFLSAFSEVSIPACWPE